MAGLVIFIGAPSSGRPDTYCATVHTIGFKRLSVLVVLGHGGRELLYLGVTEHATAFWLAQQMREAFPWTDPPKILLRDNDGAYGRVFRQRIWAMGIRDHPVAPHSPWMNGHVERVIGSIKRECLNHISIVNEEHLRDVLREYADYYNNDRTHLALDKDTPRGRAIEREGRIISRPVLGGLHHRYSRKLSK